MFLQGSRRTCTSRKADSSRQSPLSSHHLIPLSGCGAEGTPCTTEGTPCIQRKILPLNPATTKRRQNWDGNALQMLPNHLHGVTPQPHPAREALHKSHLSSSLPLTSKLLMCSQRLTSISSQLISDFTPTDNFLICHNSSAWQDFPVQTEEQHQHSSFPSPKHTGMDKENHAYRTLISHNIYWDT